MPIRTEIVNIENVFPDEHNPRDDFGDLEALAASFTINADRPGEPITPPLLVADGDVYRIVDGERRYRAMKLARTKCFTAMVADSMDDANSMLAMLVTDDKQALTEVEKSRGVQQMLLLGVEPETVAKAAHIEEREVYKVKRAGTVVTAEKARDMTLGRLYAIAEFADKETDAINAVIKAKEDDWQKVYDSESQRIKYRDTVADFISLLDNWEIEYETVDGNNRWNTVTVGGVRVCRLPSVDDPDALEEVLKEREDTGSDRIVCARLYEGDQRTTYNAPAVYLYVPYDNLKEDKPEFTPEEEARRALIARFENARVRDKNRRTEFVVAGFDDIEGNLPNIAALAVGNAFREKNQAISRFEQYLGRDLDRTCTEYLLATTWIGVNNSLNTTWTLRGDTDPQDILMYRNFIALMDALEADGYEPSPEELEIKQRASELLEKVASEAPDEDEDDEDDWDEEEDDE
jgi:hypothetical protein